MQDGLRFAIYSAATPDDEANTAIAILGAYFTTQGLKIAQAAKETTIKNAIQTTQDEAYLKGRLDEFLKLAVQVREGTDDGCLIESRTNANAHTSGSIGSVLCKLTTIPLTTDHRSEPTITQNGFTGLRDPATESKSHQEASPGCRLMSGDHTNGLGDDAQTATSITHIDGYITADADGSTEVTLADARTKSKVNAKRNKAWHDLLNPLELKVGRDQLEYANESETLETATAAADPVGRIVTDKQRQSIEETKEARERLFGAKSKDKVHKYMMTVHNYQIEAKAAGLEAKAALGTITDPATLTALLAHFQLKLRTKVKELQAALETAQKSKKPKTAEEKRKECDKHHASPDNCTKAECNYDANAADSKKCKPKPGTETTAAGTGDGAAKEGAASAGCARHGTNKEACLADKKDDKQNCTFRKGKYGKDEKETERYRNSSFNVNKKLSLMAADFVSFVWF
uniref:Variant surface glycoprotein 1125.2103 n=1 Tax=Trypanosoma brucei TaxID=5691 RepID=A0A1J0R827_9TRYP|nr:variant surface glycoprotein 1125.2103 [Trypanosoma brucei]